MNSQILTVCVAALFLVGCNEDEPMSVPTQTTFEVRVDRGEERDSILYTRMFNALAYFAAYSGVGRKTAMGMGAVELIKDRSR